MVRHDSELTGGRPVPVMSMMLMMGLAMGLCFGLVVLSGLIPVIVWPFSVAFGLIGAGAMFYIHQRVMRHGWDQ
jgi:uncharacterized membrane protein YqjE